MKPAPLKRKVTHKWECTTCNNKGQSPIFYLPSDVAAAVAWLKDEPTRALAHNEQMFREAKSAERSCKEVHDTKGAEKYKKEADNVWKLVEINKHELKRIDAAFPDLKSSQSVSQDR